MSNLNAVKAFIENEEGKVLFLKERSPKGREYYGLPGGRLEQGEDEITGLKREVFEETGLHVEAGEVLGRYSFVMDIGHKVECTVFRCKANSFEISHANAMHDERIDSFEWLSPSEFLSRKLVPVGPEFNLFLEKYLNER